MRKFLFQLFISLAEIALGVWLKRKLEYIEPEDNTNREIKRLKLKLAESEEENNSWITYCHPSNCKNCSAGLNSRICEYCNTKY